MGMMQTESNYRREWSVLAGRSESDVYIPQAIREPGPDPLRPGDRIRILRYGLDNADVLVGDVLTVLSVEDWLIETEAPSLSCPDLTWRFALDLADEGVKWERVR